MANVTGTDKFFDDPRFDTAGVLLGIDGDLVRVRMMRLWSWQTDNFTDTRPTYVVSRVELVGKLKDARAPEVLVECGLVEPRDGGFYVCGTEGEIEWLWKKKLAGARGGEVRARAAKEAGRAPRGRFAGAQAGGTDQAPTKHPPSTPPADDQAPTTPRDPESGIRIPDVSLSAGAREPSSPAPQAPAVVPSGALPVIAPVVAPSASDLATQAIELLNAARSSIDPAAQPVAWDTGFEYALAAHLRTLPGDRREAAIRHGVAAIAAAVRVGREPMESLRPGELAGPRSWGKWQAATVASIERSARAREGARPAQDRSPPAAAAPGVEETRRRLEEQRERDRRAAAEAAEVGEALADLKAKLGIASGGQR